jgi:hypothetical protein
VVVRLIRHNRRLHRLLHLVLMIRRTLWISLVETNRHNNRQLTLEEEKGVRLMKRFRQMGK